MVGQQSESMRVVPDTSERCLSILLWNTCNAQCAHCGPLSAPSDKTRNSRELISRLIQEAESLYGPGWTLSLSGGEPFLHFEELTSIIREARSHNGYTTMISNAYWARDFECARQSLLPLVQNGLKILSISADSYHDPYISFDRVVNALRAGESLGLRMTVRCVGSATSSASEIMNRLRTAGVFYVHVMEMPLVREGRGALRPDNEYLLLEHLPEGRCPSASLTIDASSNAMVCCNGGGSDKSLQLGSAVTRTLSDLEYSFASDPVINFLKKSGPAAAIDFLDEQEQSEIRSDRYVNECDLCMKIFNGARGCLVRRQIESRFLSSMQGEIVRIKRVAENRQNTDQTGSVDELGLLVEQHAD
ncbi:MAG: 4Fe-4S cluster-binding domain-containing protein [Planctomycetales bacterium]|nr:4Fe-4S cluster-binding domain-containing protein [Planctomycetales bacterium]